MARKKSIRTRTLERDNELEAKHRTQRLRMDATLVTQTRQAKTAEWFASLPDGPNETPTTTEGGEQKKP